MVELIPFEVNLTSPDKLNSHFFGCLIHRIKIKNIFSGILNTYLLCLNKTFEKIFTKLNK